MLSSPPCSGHHGAARGLSEQAGAAGGGEQGATGNSLTRGSARQVSGVAVGSGDKGDVGGGGGAGWGAGMDTPPQAICPTSTRVGWARRGWMWGARSDSTVLRDTPSPPGLRG